MARCRAEFTVEPFEEGHLGPHVAAAIAAAEGAGLKPDIGPFGTSIEGDATAVLASLDNLVTNALAAGATRVSVQLTVTAD
jgi:uncharacterized protein YqgV (UPF0045/DUF77 family)